MSASPHPFADHLATDRLVLRRLRPDDADAFAAYRSDPETARYQSWEAPYTADLARAFVAGLADERPGTPGTAFQYAIARREDDALVGDVMLATRGDRRLADLGVTLAPQARERGYATEAVARLLDHVLLDPGGVHRLQANCDARNGRSIALWHRLGFREEAVRLGAVWAKGEWTDDVEFALLAEDHAGSGGRPVQES